MEEKNAGSEAKQMEGNNGKDSLKRDASDQDTITNNSSSSVERMKEWSRTVLRNVKN